MTRGTKRVLQRWYTYRRNPYNTARPFRQPHDGGSAWQPTVSCDFVESPLNNVSCRWYSAHLSTVWAFRKPYKPPRRDAGGGGRDEL